MPRKSKELTLNSEEIAELSKIESGPDQEQALRARIILACAHENQNKRVAQQLGTSETNVRNWKEAYRRSGIEAILKSLPSGRPLSENKPANLPALISSFIEKRPDSWTASSDSQRIQSLCQRRLSYPQQAWHYPEGTPEKLDIPDRRNHG